MTETIENVHTPHDTTHALLSVRDLRVTFQRSGEKPFVAVDGVSFDVRPGETVGLVGESGCGKSVTSLAIMGLLPRRGVAVEGEVSFQGTNLLTQPAEKMRDRRGRDLGMIFQDPLSSLNPVISIGIQVTEVLERHRGLSRKAAMPIARDMLDKVGIPDPDRRLKDYPHQLSGGMRQRALIAMALACQPRLLIADEPTTALDVTIQAQILDLLERLREERRMALIIITHDMGVIAEAADDVAVMYAGQIVEQAPVLELFDQPEHPYTEALMGALPQLEGTGIREGRLTAIPGRPPDLVDPPEGCRFAARCPYVGLDACATQPQALREVRQGHLVRSSHPTTERGRSREPVTM